MKEEALLVTVDFFSVQRNSDSHALAAELEELTQGAGLVVVGSLLFKQDSPNASIFLGKGQAEKIRLEAKKKAAQVVVFESDLSPSQQRNLEEVLGVKTIDRTQLILDIFARRARSTEGKLQVELAQLKYLLPRLGGQGIYLSRLGGGVGTRGPGEQKLEVDRRRIREKITKFERELAELQVKRQTAIAKKKEKELPIVALVGYTNAGKSSLFNFLTQSEVLVKDQLFSTLDTTTRLWELPHNQSALLVDTVGFIRDLPHHLVESFKATLEEAVQADILFHVMDATREDLDAVQKAVQEVLEAIGASDKKTYFLLNKADLIDSQQRIFLAQTMPETLAIFLSSKTGEGVEDFSLKVAHELDGSRNVVDFFIPKDKAALIDFVYRKTQVIQRRDEPEGIFIQARASKPIEGSLRRQLQK